MYICPNAVGLWLLQGLVILCNSPNRIDKPRKLISNNKIIIAPTPEQRLIARLRFFPCTCLAVMTKMTGMMGRRVMVIMVLISISIILWHEEYLIRRTHGVLECLDSRRNGLDGWRNGPRGRWSPSLWIFYASDCINIPDRTCIVWHQTQ
jgi:hypothetical protein